jgi:hypothetical protein
VITEDAPVFPNNVVDLLAARFQLIDPDLLVVRRPLKHTDLAQSIGVYASMWMPDQESLEIRGSTLGTLPGPQEPSISRYMVSIQAFVKDMDEERGLATHSVLSKMVLAILYRDQPLRVGLASLSAEVLGVTERAMRWGITTQRFLNNELGDNEWLYLSTLEFWLDTEIY